MNASLNDSESKDYQEFVGSLRLLHDNLLRDYVYDDSSIVIGMSRKGPKVLEIAFSEDELSKLNIVTEFALPFLLKALQQDRLYRIYIVDDAVYFGSTLKNLIAEINEYGKLYGLQLNIRAYVALIDKDALKFADIKVFGTVGYRGGYGHYFVRNLLSRCRGLHRCMEVEFPVIEFNSQRNIEIVKITERLQDELGNSYINTYHEERIATVMFPQEDYQFAKARFYVDGKKLYVAFMAPKVLSSDIEVIKHLMDDFGPGYQSLWGKVMRHLYGDSNQHPFSDTFVRNRERSLIVLANFIFSYQLYVKYVLDLQRMLSTVGYEVSCKNLVKNAVYHLVGIRAFEEELVCLLSRDSQLVLQHQTSTGNKLPVIPRQFYEEEDSPATKERESLAAHNLHMVRNSKNIEQALAAIVFNQNIFADRWSRNGKEGPRRHLWFGYTHEALEELLHRYGRFDLHQDVSERVHQWLDGRIDQGCVVPQYIKDGQSNMWLRVFRPGENEDILLSHLARFVLHLYSQIDKQLSLGYCPKEILSQVLTIVWRQFCEDRLKDSFSFRLKTRERELCLDQGGLEKDMSVIRYLQNMYVIEVNEEGEVTASQRMIDPDFLHHTTLDNRDQKEIDNFVVDMFAQMKEWGIDTYSAYCYFNHYFNCDIETSEMVQAVKRSAQMLKNILGNIEIALAIRPDDPLPMEKRMQVFEVFEQLKNYDEHPNFYLKKGMNYKEYWHQFKTIPRVRVQHQYKALYQIINLIVGVYLMDEEYIKGYLKNNEVKTAFSMLKMDALRHYLETVEKENNYRDLRYGSTLPGLLKGFLDKMIES